LNQIQHSYQLQLSHTRAKKAIWDSRRQFSSSSDVLTASASFPSHLVQPGEAYSWRVKTWSNSPRSSDPDVLCESEWSDEATFSTALWAGTSNMTSAIWNAGSKARYSLFRKDITLNPSFGTVTSAIAHVTAAQSGGIEKLLGAFRFYINGETVGIGPGRGEVNVKDEDHTTYDTIDVTKAITSANTGKAALAFQCFHQDGGTDARVLLEMHLTYSDGNNQNTKEV
jgi:hypothetical protein